MFAPVIVTELLGPLAAMRCSNELVRGNFELVFLTAAFAVVLEEAVADAGTLGADAHRLGDLGRMVGGVGRHRDGTTGGVLCDRARVRPTAARRGPHPFLIRARCC